MDFKNIDPNKIGKMMPQQKGKLPPIPKEAFGDSLPKRNLSADNKGSVIKPPTGAKGPGRIAPDKLMAQKFIQPPKPTVMDDYVPPAIEMSSEPIHVSKTKFFITTGCIGSIFLVLVIIGIIYMFSGTAVTGGSPNYIDLVQGKDVKRHLDSSTWATLSIPTKLTSGDFLKSGDDRYNVLVTADKSTIRLNANTSVKILKIASSGTEQNISLYLYSGSIFICENPETHITVETKYAKAVPIGTRYFVAQHERKDLTEQTIIKVIEGTIQASHIDDPNAKSVIQASEQASVTAQSITKPTEIKIDNWLRWNSAWTDPSNIPDKNAGKKTPAAQKNAANNPMPDPQPQQNVTSMEEQRRNNEIEARRREEEEARKRHEEEARRFEQEQRHRREMDEKRQAEERRRADEERDRHTRLEIERAQREEEERQRQQARNDEFERLRRQDEQRAKTEGAERDKNRPAEDPYNIKTGNVNDSQPKQNQTGSTQQPPPPPPGSWQAPNGSNGDSDQTQNGVDAVTTTGTIMMPTGRMDDITAKKGKRLY